MQFFEWLCSYSGVDNRLSGSAVTAELMRCACCGRFKASLYPCPETPQEREEMLKGVNTRLEDLKTVSRSWLCCSLNNYALSGGGRWVGAVCTWFECLCIVLACESLHVCTVCMWYEWPLLFLAFKAYMYGLCVSGMSVLW